MDRISTRGRCGMPVAASWYWQPIAICLQVHRLVLPILLHAGILHIVANLFFQASAVVGVHFRSPFDFANYLWDFTVAIWIRVGNAVGLEGFLRCLCHFRHWSQLAVLCGVIPFRLSW